MECRSQVPPKHPKKGASGMPNHKVLTLLCRFLNNLHLPDGRCSTGPNRPHVGVANWWRNSTCLNKKNPPISGWPCMKIVTRWPGKTIHCGGFKNDFSKDIRDIPNLIGGSNAPWTVLHKSMGIVLPFVGWTIQNIWNYQPVDPSISCIYHNIKPR